LAVRAVRAEEVGFLKGRGEALEAEALAGEVRGLGLEGSFCCRAARITLLRMTGSKGC
jgi:hypothetical protein